MESRNLDKIKPFLEMYDKGDIIYREGALYRTVKRVNQYKQIALDHPELMRFDSERGYWRVSYLSVTCYEHSIIYAIHYGIEAMRGFECIDHKDGNKKNNLISNLEGVTIDENNIRAKNNGLLKTLKGSDNGSSALKEADISNIRKIYRNRDHDQYEIAKMYGVSQSAISNIIRRKRWGHVD